MYTAQGTWDSGEPIKLDRLWNKPIPRNNGNEPSHSIKYYMLLIGLNTGKTVSFLTKHVKLCG